MASVTFDDRSILVGGKRIWLVSGSVHYFRIPVELWRDRLLKARRAGLNCISTFVPWNYHEPEEGQWEFSDEKDVSAFVRMAGKLGLYVILRPGPYIGADWDCGGLPAWLAAKTGVAYRTSSATFTHYFDKFFRRLLPKLAELQVSRGGNIILIQNENQYPVTTMPDRLGYLEFISQLFHRSGFDIPIISSNNFTDPPVPGGVECVASDGNEIQFLKRMRLRQPNAPLLVTDFATGSGDNWSQEHNMRDGRQVARRAMETLGCGAQYNYYTWCGGTNFAFWAGQHPEGESLYQTTSYDYDAPLAEGGGLTEKYYLTRPVNMLANHMGKFFASSILEQPGVTIHDSSDVLNLNGSLCNWAIVTNHGRDEITSAKISLPEGQELSVSLEPFGAAAIPVELDLSPTQMLDYSNLTPLGLFGEKLLVLHGSAGWDAKISINGLEVQAEVPTEIEPEIIEHQGIILAIINSEAAMRTWLIDDCLIIGPNYVGENLDQIVDAHGVKQYPILSLDGKLSHKKSNSERSRRSTPPHLGHWKRLGLCLEPLDKSKQDAWIKIPGPKDVDSLGVHHGYAWYRIEMKQPRAKKHNIFLPDCEDRALLFLNGNPLGVWGRGDDAKRTPISASFKKGTNVLTVMVDNMGRFTASQRIGQRKGLFGHIYDAKALRTSKFKLKPMESFSKRLIPRQQTFLMEELKKQKTWSAEINVSLTKVAPIHLSFKNVPHHLAIICNERLVGFFANSGMNFGDVTLGAELKKGKNAIKLVMWGEVAAKTLDNVKFHALNESLSEQADWRWCPWTTPEDKNSAGGRDMPAWYCVKFKTPSSSQPLFLHVAGAKKGQLFLNGRNIGRFWKIGPQHDYYLPPCWMEGENELLLFDEQGKSPSPSKLLFHRNKK